MTVILAVLAIYLVDFSINAVQALDRALLVDTLPPSLQPTGNAWAAGMLGFGAVVGFFMSVSHLLVMSTVRPDYSLPTIVAQFPFRLYFLSLEQQSFKCLVSSCVFSFSPVK